MKLSRRQFSDLIAGAAMLPIAPHIATAASYPSRPVRIIVGFPAGGGRLASVQQQASSYHPVMPSPRRFPPPWSIEERQACFIVKDGNGQALAYVYFEEEPDRRSAENLMSHDEAGDLALNIAKLPELLRQPRMTRWGEVIDNLLADLETETPGAEGFRVNIDHKIWEAEKIARGAPTTTGTKTSIQ
jgi:hypothetical protein